MARPRRVTCRVCNRHISECGKLSTRGRCFDCGIGKAIQNADDLHNMRGEALEVWRAGVARGVGATLPPKDKPKGTDE